MIIKKTAGSNKVNSLTELQKTIWDARPRYFNIGLDLGIDENTIQSIQISKKDRVEDCFQAVLSECVKKGITWDQVAEVLKAPAVGYEMLAEQVQERFCQ